MIEQFGQRWKSIIEILARVFCINSKIVQDDVILTTLAFLTRKRFTEGESFLIIDDFWHFSSPENPIKNLPSIFNNLFFRFSCVRCLVLGPGVTAVDETQIVLTVLELSSYGRERGIKQLIIQLKI